MAAKARSGVERRGEVREAAAGLLAKLGAGPGTVAELGVEQGGAAELVLVGQVAVDRASAEEEVVELMGKQALAGKVPVGR